ncbi:MAG: hypothetical protein BWZ10_02751 [candidate division BRC1 bacterium ADurb.BinA364]|nr:MAG: hypothetical protein BWZ10_02751 [candidate division BRC1 bacterium ADurb.BinA364]
MRPAGVDQDGVVANGAQLLGPDGAAAFRRQALQQRDGVAARKNLAERYLGHAGLPGHFLAHVLVGHQNLARLENGLEQLDIGPGHIAESPDADRAFVRIADAPLVFGFERPRGADLGVMQQAAQAGHRHHQRPARHGAGHLPVRRADAHAALEQMRRDQAGDAAGGVADELQSRAFRQDLLVEPRSAPAGEDGVGSFEERGPISGVERRLAGIHDDLEAELARLFARRRAPQLVQTRTGMHGENDSRRSHRAKTPMDFFGAMRHGVACAAFWQAFLAGGGRYFHRRHPGFCLTAPLPPRTARNGDRQ